MIWHLEWGEHLDFLEDAESKTGETPLALQNRPERTIWIEEYVRAFEMLSRCRTIGFSSPNPISFQDIVAYAKIHDVEDFETFSLLIKYVDEKYLKHFAQTDTTPTSK